MASAQLLCSLSTARNGHSVRLGNFAKKLKITICALSIACTNKKSPGLYKIVFTRELCEKWHFERILVFSC